MTLSDNWVVSGLLSLGNSTFTTTVNGSQITCNGGLTINGTTGDVIGTTVIILAGTGTFTNSAKTTGTLKLPITINTTGTITFSTINDTTNAITYQRGILAGNIVGLPKTIGFAY